MHMPDKSGIFDIPPLGRYSTEVPGRIPACKRRAGRTIFNICVVEKNQRQE